ncbi:MAG: hypothetical protein A2583_02725 [Bdellovibrionales bacterium RIFOXYD1_FULL_53_11]|nr:MAG: hypothetical protein A2583_02725 [Bdellovibrionales bacterium RIFOXYD1_FULL_53_11]
MARYKDKSKAIELRKKGYSYNQIKEILSISKGTLSDWLKDYPLSDKRIKELRDNNPKRIENYIRTMTKKRNEKFSIAFEKAKGDIGKITKRELFIAGFFLYWAEGGKTTRHTITLTNTDPAMLKVYIKWIESLRVPKEELKVKLHLYKDMNEDREIRFWSNELGINKSKFNKTWIKDSKMSDLTYKNNFGHGTCNVILNNTTIAMYVLMGIKFIANVVGMGDLDNMRA